MSEGNSPPYTFKFLIVGDGGVGKTSIANRLCHHEFIDTTESTVGVEYLSYTLNVEDQQIKLQIWDTAGQEEYKALGKAYYRNAVGVLLVFAFNDEKSFENISAWLEDIRSLCNPNAQVLLIGNKFDLTEEKKIAQIQIDQVKEANKLDFLETSAKDDLNIEIAFRRLTEAILQKVKKNEINLQANYQQLKPQSEDARKNGCGCGK
ncbi:Ras family protein [Histomonas meleagridis]|uniref:Ras family protein n=1 Tax=Histomonas meleagridis TaxID=135588 RepID=UPI003559E810|nr:Ras family protein [Histomonas meleagridis]KAH0802058.1 Ras family protein [Histomonas meleagridis]